MSTATKKMPSRRSLDGMMGLTALVLLAACPVDKGDDPKDAGVSDLGSADGAGTDAGETDSATAADAAFDASWYKPAVDTTWQWQINGSIQTRYDVDLYDVDLFDAPTSTISALQAQGRKVICYFSAGSSENWRDDALRFVPADLGNDLVGWVGEKWLDVRSPNVRGIMADRLDLAVTKGCDGVEPDNVDGYTNDNGFSLTAADQLDFNRWLFGEAHARQLAVGLKNDLDQIADLIDVVDFALNEQCFSLGECDALAPFIAAGKPVFNAEYVATEGEATTLGAALCADARTRSFHTLILPEDLDDEFRVSCEP